jgi:hypothetical protein
MPVTAPTTWDTGAAGAGAGCVELEGGVDEAGGLDGCVAGAAEVGALGAAALAPVPFEGTDPVVPVERVATWLEGDCWLGVLAALLSGCGEAVLCARSCAGVGASEVGESE